MYKCKNCNKLTRKIERLGKKLKSPQKVDFRKRTRKFCWTGKQPKKRKLPKKSQRGN